MKVSKNFILQEFVDPVTYKAMGEKSLWLIDKRIIDLAQFLRDHFNVPVIINNWHLGGRYDESGLRQFNTTTGATRSQHKYGRAADLKFSGLKPEEIRNEIRKSPILLSLGLTTIEKDTPTWVHIDCRYTGLDKLLEVPYK
jgi:hypothetical protein